MSSENEIEINDELIVKYLAGEATPDEAMALMDWLENIDNKFYFENLSATWNSANPVRRERPIDREAAWKVLDKKIASAPKVSSGRSLTIPVGLGIAASIALVIVVSVMVYLKLKVNPDKTVQTTNDFENVTFSDNSTVKLHHNTSITFPVQFKGDSREVKMTEGEAFFSVTADRSIPFIIHALHADITVIGTQFNVIVKDNSVEVGVSEGKVILSTASSSADLTKGSSGIVNLSDGEIKTTAANENTWAYATHRFEFNDTPLGEIIEDVEKAFGCSISVSNNNIKNCKMTATFGNESAENIVDLIAETLNLSLTKNAGVFRLEGEGCP